MSRTESAFLREPASPGASRPRFTAGPRIKVADGVREAVERRALGALFREARSRKGIPQGIAAHAIGTTQYMLSSWERGERPMPPEARVRLAALYDMDPALIAGLDLDEVAVTPVEVRVLALLRRHGEADQGAFLDLLDDPGTLPTRSTPGATP